MGKIMKEMVLWKDYSDRYLRDREWQETHALYTVIVKGWDCKSWEWGNIIIIFAW